MKNSPNRPSPDEGRGLVRPEPSFRASSNPPLPLRPHRPLCGFDIPPQEHSRIVALAGDWDLQRYLDRIRRAPIALPASEVAELRDFFLDAAQTEFDAEHLCHHLERERVALTPEFKTFEREWRLDEHLHYLGFLAVHSRLYPETSEAELAERIESAEPDFAPIAELVQDEFHVLVAVAFDEACTARSYAAQLPFYERFGDPVFAEWVAHLARDEVNHFRNALAVLRSRHADRLHEIPGLLEDFLAHDRSGSGYRNTFLFDHSAYTEKFLAEVAARICRVVTR